MVGDGRHILNLLRQDINTVLYEKLNHHHELMPKGGECNPKMGQGQI